MRVFTVTTDAHEPEVVFAPTPDDAAGVSVTWQMANEIHADRFTVDWKWVSTLSPAE